MFFVLNGGVLCFTGHKSAKISRIQQTKWLNIFCYWCDLPLLAVFIIFVLFCLQVVHFIHLVFGQTGESNSHPRTMAQTVSPWRLPLDQGPSPQQTKWLKYKSGQILKQLCTRVNSINISLILSWAAFLRVFAFHRWKLPFATWFLEDTDQKS